MDDGHVKYILTSGFSSWIKGDAFMRALYVALALLLDLS